MKNKENTLGANKQMAFLNTTKLAVLSAMLLLAVFCTIGMSFTPAEEGENIGNPNDSTYITGPRRSHWKESGCSTTYNNETDFAEVHAQVIVWDEKGNPITENPSKYGSVTLSGDTIVGKSGDYSYGASITQDAPNEPSENAVIKWNSSNQYSPLGDTDEAGEDIIKNRHTLKVEVKANVAPESDYEFYGWTKVEWDGTVPTTKPDKLYDANLTEDGLTIKESIIIGNGENGFVNYNSNEHKSYTSGNPYRVMYYAHFAPPKPQTITLGLAANGTYTYTDGTQSGTISNTEGSITTSKQITLKATPASDDYEFFGWYENDGNQEKYLSYESPWSKKFTTPTTIYAKFIPSKAALFIIKDDPDKKQFWNLNEACEKALSSSSKVVLPKEDGTLYPLVDGELCKSIPEGKTATDYTIPHDDNGAVTLLVPYDKSNTPHGAAITTVNSANAKPSCYKTLTLAPEVNIIVSENGSIEVGGQQNSAGQWDYTIGAPRAHGQIKMCAGSSITLDKNANLYCWGYIIGDNNLAGEITADGAKVYECLQLRDWKGGNISTHINNQANSKKVFPANQYYVQNIEVPITFKNNAENLVSTAVEITLAGTVKCENVPFVTSNDKTNGLFKLSNSTSLTRRYNTQNDRIEYTLNGDATFQDLNLNLKTLLGGVDIQSSNFLLPFTNNMTLTIASGNITVTSDIVFCADAKVHIKEGAKCTLNNLAYLYDKDQWGNYAFYTQLRPLLYSNGTNYTHNNDLSKSNYIRKQVSDASICVDGELIINENAKLYTTESGANIHSTKNGKITFKTKVTNSTTEVWQAYKQLDGDTKKADFESNTANPAWLHNGKEWYGEDWKNNEWYKEDANLEYLETKDCDANTTITYANNHWGWMEIWKDHNGTLKINNTCAKVNNSSAYTPEGLTNFIGWSTEIDETNQEVIHTVLYSFGPELDIVDADGANLTVNANGWASSGWPYTINGTEYGKDDKAGKEKYRQADRTLVIPYTGPSGASLPIAVLDQEGKPICRHIYKVPFVYTSDDTLSDTDENSENRIVFVKSGTLSIDGTASAKEIYVAPGAELKVNGELDVEKLVLRTTPWQAAVLTNSGTINGQVYYSRIAPNKSTIKDLQNTEIEYNSARYYQFGLPLSCSISSVTMSNTGKFGESNTPYGNTWLLKSYNESKRAENGISSSGDNWEALESTGTITAGVGYEMFSNSNYYREFYFPVTLPATATTTVGVSYTGGTKAEHNGWNIVCSPLTGNTTVSFGDPATAIKPCWLLADGSYTQEIPEIIPPAIPFAYQTSTAGTLNFVVSTAAAAPRRQSATEALTETEWVHLDIFDAYGEGDETSLFVHPTRFEQTYKTGIDVAKQSLTASRAILYSTHAYGYMAFAGVADTLLETGIDLVVYSPSAQELTFSLRENKFLNRLEYLWLIDNKTGGRTDLLLNNYTFLAAAGTAKGRFVLNGRFKAPQISTGIGNTQTDYNIYAIGNNIAISGVEQGTPIYVFDAVGHMIYTTAATSDEVIVPAPCAGVYMLTIGGQTAKLVINQ